MENVRRIVVVGGGYAGLAALAVLSHRRDVELSLLDPEPGQVLVTELVQALDPDDDPGTHQIAFADLFRHTAIRHYPVRVTRIMASRRQVASDDGRLWSFDQLVLAPGSESAVPPHAGWTDHAWPLRRLEDALALRDCLARADDQRVAVVGAGLTGVEVAGRLSARHRVTLIEQSGQVLPGFGPGLSLYAAHHLSLAGVRIMTGAHIRAVGAGTIAFEAEPPLAYDVLVWAGGQRAPGWIADGDLIVGSDGYPVVDAWGRNQAGIYVAGDLWRVPGTRRPTPPTAQVAVLAGAFVGRTLLAELDGASLPNPFAPRLQGLMVSLTPHHGVGWVRRGGIPIVGPGAAWAQRFAFRQYRRQVLEQFDR